MTEIHCFTSDPAALNSYLVVGDERALVIDTGAGPQQAGAILAAFRSVTDKPFVVANTHDHWDHCFGNATFAEAGVTEFVAGAGFVRDQAGSAWYQFHSVPLDAEPQLPADPSLLIVDVRALEDRDSLDLGGTVVTTRELSGHTESDLVLFCEGVAFTGDLVEEAAAPSVGDDAAPGAWAQALREILTVPDITVFAPGHGQPVDRAFVQAQAGMLAALAADDQTELHSAHAQPYSWAATGPVPGLGRLR